MNELNGKRVVVSFRQPMHHDGIEVISMSGTCGGFDSRLFALNNVQRATGPANEDVTDKLNIRGKSTLFNTNNIGFVVSDGS